LLPPDTLVLSDAGADAAEVERAWTEAAHHLDVARRRGEDVPGREAVLRCTRFPDRAARPD
jgi:hypothetical protein